MGFDFLKQGANNLKAIGFGAAMPELRDRVLGAVSGDTQAQNDAQMASMQTQLDEEKKKREAQGTPMKKGGKVAGRLATRGYGIAKK